MVFEVALRLSRGCSGVVSRLLGGCSEVAQRSSRRLSRGCLEVVSRRSRGGLECTSVPIPPSSHRPQRAALPAAVVATGNPCGPEIPSSRFAVTLRRPRENILTQALFPGKKL